MLQVVNTSSVNGAPVAPGPGPYVVSAVNSSQISLWCATAMDLSDSSGVPNTIAQESARTSTTCYFRGVSEKIRIQTSSGLPWFWRRICFRAKSAAFLIFAPTDSPTSLNGGNPTFIETSNGMQRLFLNQTINSANNTVATWSDIVFKGTVNVDWVDVQTAPIDTRRVDLVSDRRTTIRSGNQAGTVKDTSHWIPYNHNLVYDDEERGNTNDTRYVSVRDKQGNGDLYVMDIFTPGTGGGTTDLLQLTATATSYWHEK